MNKILDIAVSALYKNLSSFCSTLPPTIDGLNYVIVVQGGTVPEIKHSFRDDVTLVFDNGFGVSRSRNKAIASANAEFTLFCDDDILLIQEDIVELISFLKNQENDCFLLDVRASSGKKIFNYKSIKAIGKREALKCWAVRLCVRTSIAKKIRFQEKISIGTDIPLGEETVFTNKCLKNGFQFFKIPLAPAQLKHDEHSGIKNSPLIFRAKGIISAYIWKKNVFFYGYNLFRLGQDLILVIIRRKPNCVLYKYLGIYLYLTDKNIRDRFLE